METPRKRHWLASLLLLSLLPDVGRAEADRPLLLQHPTVSKTHVVFSYGANHSEAGADMQAVLMSVFRTLKQRGHNPLQTIVQALRAYLLTRQLPPLPDKLAADG